jgi:uncharacterized protein (DUF1015 family)
MPDIQAFRGLRYNLAHVGSLSDVIAPPYDVIDSALQDQLYKQHPANVVRLILNRDEPGDDSVSNRYTRAARFLKNWRSEGLLITEPDPAVYVYHQHFDYAGQSFTRRGFMARARLERFGEGKIYPHEETMSGPKQDRLLLTEACKTNLSQIFGLFPDPKSEAQALLDAAIAERTPLEATDHLGVLHRVWPVTEVSTLTQLSGIMGPKPIFIADGHHRYETACNYRDKLAAGGTLDPNHPANFVLMMCVGMSDPGMVVMPTHRLFRGLPDMSAADLVRTLDDCFRARDAGQGSSLAQSVWEEIESEADQGTMAFFTRKDSRWTIAKITDAGRARLREAASEHSDTWRDLAVSILHRLVIDTLLAANDLPKPRYVHLVDEVVEGLDTGEFPLAAMVLPATLDHIEILGEGLERMPAKSTYFYPKLLSGLVFNPLE